MQETKLSNEWYLSAEPCLSLHGVPATVRQTDGQSAPDLVEDFVHLENKNNLFNYE